MWEIQLLEDPYYMQVCPIEAEWAEEVLPKLRNVDVERLSGGATAAKAAAQSVSPVADVSSLAEVNLQVIRKNDAAAVGAARERFLARKAAKRK